MPEDASSTERSLGVGMKTMPILIFYYQFGFRGLKVSSVPDSMVDPLGEIELMLHALSFAGGGADVGGLLWLPNNCNVAIVLCSFNTDTKYIVPKLGGAIYIGEGAQVRIAATSLIAPPCAHPECAVGQDFFADGRADVDVS
jgi:hypothetical protein